MHHTDHPQRCHQQHQDDAMKASPRSIMLTWVNAVAGWGRSAAGRAAHRQRGVVAEEVKPKPVVKAGTTKRIRRRRTKKKPR